MPVAMECEGTIIIFDPECMPNCQHCLLPFQKNQVALALYERWRHRSYLVHAACEKPLIQMLESEDNPCIDR